MANAAAATRFYPGQNANMERKVLQKQHFPCVGRKVCKLCGLGRRRSCTDCTRPLQNRAILL